MSKAIAYVGDTVIAESDDTVIVEGNNYFPKSDVKAEYLKDSDLHTTCHWKGLASYYDVEAGNQKLENAAWYYPEPKTEQAQVIKDRIAFWNGVIVEEK